jgi:phospholipid/cholesterol/gamma-HCH transport system substrate-binding protein
MRGRRLLLAATGVLAAALISGCQGLYGVTLPGAVGAGSNSYQVTAIFNDVNQLVPNAAVKVADVTVGSVTQVTLTRDFKARVVMHVLKSAHLPANSIATLDQTSLLGEKFIELGPPPGARGVGRLRPNAVLNTDQTANYPQLEETLGALSMVLNGGGLQNLQTINSELANAMHGHEADIRSLLTNLTRFVGSLNQQRGAIVATIDQLDRLTSGLAAQRSAITTGLTNLGPGLAVLANERVKLVQLLSSLSRLGQVSAAIINASGQNTIADFNAMRPVLGQLEAAGAAFPRSFDIFFDYPFPHTSVYGIPGDYTNLWATINAQSLCALPSFIILANQQLHRANNVFDQCNKVAAGKLNLPHGRSGLRSPRSPTTSPSPLLSPRSPLPSPSPSISLGGLLAGGL